METKIKLTPIQKNAIKNMRIYGAVTDNIKGLSSATVTNNRGCTRIRPKTFSKLKEYRLILFTGTVGMYNYWQLTDLGLTVSIK